MKTKIILALQLLAISVNAQVKPANLTSVAVFPIDSRGLVLDQYQMSNLVRIELEKTGLFNVMDRYDLQSKLEKSNLNIDKCYSVTCLTETGKAIGAAKVLSGSAERYNEKIIISLKLVDISTGRVEKNQINEFLNVQQSLPIMLAVCLRDLLGLPNDPDMVKKLTSADYASTVNNPGIEKLKLSGPRMGFTILTGSDASRIREGKDVGGYDAFPVMSQFGYQFETQYLNSGSFQALFEFVPLITGMDQGYFIPSLSIFNGLRNNRTGWEFAFGPSFSFVRKADGFYDSEGNWHIEKESSELNRPVNGKVPYSMETRIDSRGDVHLNSFFVFAVGKTFKSGSLNIPVNMYLIPSKNGVRLGASFGFNTR